MTDWDIIRTVKLVCALDTLNFGQMGRDECVRLKKWSVRKGCEADAFEALTAVGPSLAEFL